ncbi:MAG: hypothetical protein JO023_00460 [Chloroflexi bacterium]|nr:hypothetical protein [Chloroflexota bacterium]
MDEVEQRIEAFKARATAPVRARLDAMLDLERLHDPRAAQFLLDLLADTREPTPVRLRALRRLRNGAPTPELRPAIAQAMLIILSHDTSQELRLQAALALAHFSDVDGVATALGLRALDSDEPIDLRYSAFTSLQRAGATAESVALLRQLTADETLGRSAQNILRVWHLT